VKNITVSLDDQIYRRARIIAAERGTSVSALVRQFLDGLANDGDETAQLKRHEAALREQITRFRATDRLSREDVHHRGREK
jgi:plasmid stability protein